MPFRPPQHPGRVVIVAGGLLVALSLGIVFLTATETGTGTASRPTAIEDQFPPEAAVIRAQETVGVDLRDNLVGVLFIDGNRIPEDQYIGSPELGVFQFRPGEDQEFREFEPGTHEIRVRFWPAELTEEQATEQEKVGAYAWTFKVS